MDPGVDRDDSGLGDDLIIALRTAGAVVSTADLDNGWVLALDGDIAAIMGYTNEQWLTLDHYHLIHPDDVGAYWLDPSDVHPGQIVDRVARFRHADGTWRWIREVAHIGVDGEGRRTMRGFFFDVTRERQASAKLALLARTDTVTGLRNRLALNEWLAEAIDAGSRFALLMIDLDRFKEVNDTLGHEAGDQMLVTVADRLRKVLGDSAELFRVGGDEYAIAVPGASRPDDVSDLVAALAADCSEPISAWGLQVAISMSVGVAFGGGWGGTATDRATVLRQADIAMYAAKRAGVTHRVFDASLDRTSTIQLELTAALDAALAAGDIELHYQPQFDLATGAIVGCEGLARWHHRAYGILAPATFLDVALMSESIVAFTMQMIAQAAAMAKRAGRDGHPLPVAVNVPMRALRDVAFASNALAVLADAGIDPRVVTIEITENDVVEPSSEMLAGLARLHVGGVRVAVDDFGTGHSSLARLQAIHVDELKIDRTFVEAVAVEPRDQQIVASIVGLARGLGLRVVAEGVETVEQADTLRALGCAYAQGFLLSEPLPAAELIALTRR